MAVVLVCPFCSRVQTIHVPREKGTRGRICWECFQCQESAARHPAPRAKRATADRGPANG
jgi:hypothetical protein